MKILVLIEVEAVPVGSKPLVAVGMRIYTGERCGFGASAPLLTRTSPIDFTGAGGSAITQKLVKLVGPSSTFTE